jgi:GT2 family glycosyltransferase
LKDLAPIILFVYNRPEHTARTLAALHKNKLADKSILYIFCDGPKADASNEQLDKIKQVRKVCHAQQWCGEVKIMESDANKGLANSIIAGVTQIVNLHGKAIVLEDDIETNIGFLEYMNHGLQVYENEHQVGGISSHSFTNHVELDDFYFLPITSSWGWATWKRVWDNINFNTSEISKAVKENSNFKHFNFGNYPYFEMLESQSKGLIDSWAIRFYANFFIQNKWFLFPRLAFSNNVGFDNSGTHCDDNNYFALQINIETKPAVKIEVEIKENNLNLIQNFFKDQIKKMNSTKKQSANGLNWFKHKIKKTFGMLKG